MDGSDDPMGRPMSIKEIAVRADQYMWNPSIPLKYWIRAAEAILHEARVSAAEGNYENAYMLFTRHCSLVLSDLSRHPEAKTPANKHAISLLTKRIPAILDDIQAIRPLLESAYNDWLATQAAQKARRGGSNDPRQLSEGLTRSDTSSTWSRTGKIKVLDAGEHQDLAVDLAKQELQRRAHRRAARRESLTEEEEHERRTGGVWDDWDGRVPSDADVRLAGSQELQRQMQATRRALDRRDSSDLREDSYSQLRYSTQESIRPAPERASSSTNYYYPSISQSSAVSYETRPNQFRTEPPTTQPPRPAKILSPPPSYNEDVPPPVPEKEVLHLYAPTPVRPSAGQLDVPQRPPKEREAASKPPRPVTFRAAAYLENGEAIRPVFLPSRLRERFLEVAADNTRLGLETCGILCGTLVNNALFISVLLIPEQKSTADTCETENESAMLDYCIEHDLLIVGWIHTHPTQTCFMSSRDLHTQAGYQVMMPESIAIVCAPQHEPSWGIFRLTNPPGLGHILQCGQSETFHQHSIDNIYTDAGHPPGHVYETSKFEFKVEDLRPGFRK